MFSLQTEDVCYNIFANSLPNLEAKSLEIRVKSYASKIAIAAKLFKVLTYAFWLGSIPFSRISASKIFWTRHLVTWETVVFCSVSYCHIILVGISTEYLLISICNTSWVLADDFCGRKTTYLVIKGVTSRLNGFEKFSLKFSISLFVIRVNLLHP